MRQLTDWVRWRKRFRSNDVLRRGWRIAKQSLAFKEATRTRWRLVCAEIADRSELLTTYFKGADETRSEYHDLCDSLGSSDSFCVFAIDNTDTSGPPEFRSEHGKNYLLIIDMDRDRFAFSRRAIILQ